MKLKKVNLPIDERDKRVCKKKHYLAKINDKWFAGKFSKEWYGWFFEPTACVYPGHQVDGDGSNWQELYEIR